MKLFVQKFFIALFVIPVFVCSAQQKELVYDAGKYILYRDSIVQQHQYIAKVLSDAALVSNYKSPANLYKSAAISFKFSINGKDNEMKSGIDHHFVCLGKDGYVETPLIKFGTQLNNVTSKESYLAPETKLRIRLDMREVMNDFKTKGYYTAFNGEKIYKDDFKGVYVAGSSAPLTWDFDNLVNHPQLQLHDQDGDGIYEVVLNMNHASDARETAAQWELSKDLSAFPVYSSSFPVSDVLYKLALEEMVKAVEPDSTFRTGKEWAGVWTRDISYSIILSMAHMQPAVARKSLLRKVNKRKRIIQDTGTGGAWPVSTDRMIWAVAAWELYEVTGDKDWLQEAYIIVKNSIDDDAHTVYDPQTGLVKGESSFLDWREQTYPKWMQPVDIAESECLGTNAVHYQANIVLGKMAEALGKKDIAAHYQLVASKIKKGINKYLWLPNKNYYGQYLYGRHHLIVSPRSEALGEALCIIFGIANKEQQQKMVSHMPITDYGISCIYPQIPDIPPYHNNAVWPFVQAYWLWAGVKAGNEHSVMESIAAIYRPAAMFVTNKENFVAENGDFQGTQINSSNMLWSLSGNISIIHKVLFGIHFQNEGLTFHPFVPRALADKRRLENFNYRKSVLDIEMDGYGNHISRFLLDGKLMRKASLPAGLRGRHSIEITLDNHLPAQDNITKVPVHTSLPMPGVYYENGRLDWQSIKGAIAYKVLKDGKQSGFIKENHIAIDSNEFAEYQVIAIDGKGFESFASEPILVNPTKKETIVEAEQNSDAAEYNYQGYSGKGFTEISTTLNRSLVVPVDIKEDGLYAIDFRYANGNGPTNTENKCVLRSLKVDGENKGTSLFPQRGKGEWSNWGFSNSIQVNLKKGHHKISLVFEDWNNNMNESVNQAMIDYLRIMKLR